MIKLPDTAQLIINSLQKSGYNAYAVGGSVRDILLGKPTKGWDFTTSATPEQILTVFPDSFYDNQFGTVGVKIYSQVTGDRLPDASSVSPKPDDIFEITTYRSEEGYSDRRRPDKVTWGDSLEKDLSRRDFTINAIACDGKTVIDPYSGQKDLEAKIVRTVGNASERFSEDALRMMRAIRIAAELGFTIEEQTFAAIRTNAQLLKSISVERVRDELFRILASNFAADAIMVLRATGILVYILPEVEASFSTQQKSPKRHHMFDVGTHSLLALKHCPSTDPLVRLATLVHDIGKVPTYHKDDTGLITFYNHEVVGARMAKGIAQRLRLSKADSDKLFTLVRWHQFTVDERQTDSAIRRFIRRVTKEYLPDMLALRIGDRLGGGARETSWRLELFKKRLDEVQEQPFSVTDLKITGFDVMKELDVKPGPIVGKALAALFAEVEEGKLANEKEALVSRLKELKSQLVNEIN